MRTIEVSDSHHSLKAEGRAMFNTDTFPQAPTNGTL